MLPARERTSRIPALAVLLACLYAPFVAGSGKLEPYPADSPLPDLGLPDLKGEMHQLADYRGKVVLVNFWASWCSPCIKEMPGLQRLQEKLEGQPLVILPVNVGEKKYRVWKFVKLINFTPQVLLDMQSQAFAEWNASVLPTSFLVDAEGRIRYRVQGDLEWDSEAVIAVINELMATAGNAP